MFKSCAPIIPVADVTHAVDWLRQMLGFEAGSQSETYAYLHRDGAILRLVRKSDDMDMSDPKRQQSCYLEVLDVDAVFDAQRPALERLQDGEIRPPFDRDYGMREFHVIYKSLLIFVGQPIPEGTSQ